MRSLVLLLGWYMMAAVAGAQVRIVRPQAGDVYPTSGTTVVEWTGTTTQDVVDVDFSADGGATFSPIATGLSGASGRIVWSPLPVTPSMQCRIRVTARRTTTTGPIRLHDTIAARSIALSRDGSHAAIANDSGLVTLYDAVSGAVLASQRVDQADALNAIPSTQSVVFDRTEQHLIVLTEDDSVAVLALPTLTILSRFATGARSLRYEDRDIVAHPTRDEIAVASFDTVRVFRYDGTLIGKADPFPVTNPTFATISDVDYSRDGTVLLASAAAYGHSIMDATTLTVRRTISTPAGFAFKGSLSPQGTRILSRTKNNPGPIIFDTSSTTPLTVFPYDTRLQAFDAAWTESGNVVFASGNPPAPLTEYDVPSATAIRTQYVATNSPVYQIHTCTVENVLAINAGTGGYVYRPSNPQSVSDIDTSDVFSIETPVATDTVIRISVDTIRIRSTDRTQMVIRLDAIPDPSRMAGITGLSVLLAWNGSILSLESQPTILNADNRRFADALLPLSNTSQSILAQWDASASLGTDSTSIIEFINAITIGDSIPVYTRDGAIILTDVCQQGGPRLIQPSTSATPLRITNDGIQIQALESGAHTIDIFDIHGRVLVSSYLSTIVGTPSVVLPSLPSGIYTVRLTTPSAVFTVLWAAP
jgi:hypothetical protein